MHFGVILPNYGLDSNPDGIRRVAEAAEELGFDSVWATEHIIVGREAVDPYGRVYAPLVTLGWVAGWTERIGLGTSIVLVPLHHPMHLAKEVATLERRARLRGRVLVVPRRDVGPAPVAAAGDLGRRQLGARDPAGARAGGRLASVARLGRRPRP